MLILNQYQHSTSAHRSAATTVSSSNLPAPRLGSHPITIPLVYIETRVQLGHTTSRVALASRGVQSDHVPSSREDQASPLAT